MRPYVYIEKDPLPMHGDNWGLKSSTYKSTMNYVSTSIEPDVQASCYKQMVSRSPTKLISYFVMGKMVSLDRQPKA